MSTATTSRPSITPFAPMSRQAMRARLEAHREAIAQQMWMHTSAISVLQKLMDDSEAFWESSQPDEAPAFEPRMRLVSAS